MSASSKSRFELNLDRRTKIGILLLFTAVYVLIFVPFYSLFGGGVLAFAVFPIAAWGLLGGRSGGVLAGVVAVPLNTLLLNLVGYQAGGWDVILRSGSLPASLINIVIGYAFGYLGDLYARAQSELREREAVTAALKWSEEKYRELFNTATRQAQEMALRAEVRAALARELDLAVLYRTVVEGIARTLGYTQVSLYLLQDQTLRLQHQVGYTQVIPEIPITQGISGRVARTGVPQFIPDIRADPDFIGAIEGIVSEICVPLIQEHHIVGILNVESTRGIALTEGDLQMITGLGESINIAIGRARVYAELRESQALLETVFEFAPDAIVIADEAGTIVRVNHHVATLFGYTRDELLGRPLEILLPDRFRERHIAHRQKFATAPYVRSMGAGLELLGKRKDEREFPIDVTLGPLRLTNSTLLISIIRDITKREQAEKALYRQNNYLSALHAITLDLVNRREFDDLLQSIVERATALLDAPYVEIMLAEENYLVTRAFTKNQPLLLGDRVTRDDAQLSWQAFDTKRPVQIENYSALEKQRAVYRDLNLRALLSVPILAGARCIGVLACARDQPGKIFTPEEIQIAGRFAEMLALALDNAQLYAATRQELQDREKAEKELHARARHLRLLNEITQSAIGAHSLSALLQMLADRLGELFDTNECFITLWDETLQRTIPAAGSGEWRATYPRAQSEPGELTITESVLRAGHPLVIEDTFDSPYLSPRVAARYPRGSILGLPLIVGEQKLGAALISSELGHHFSDEELARAEQVSGQIALALAKARLLDQVQLLARTDSLTGVSNRRYLFELGESEFHRARRLDHPLAAIMFDLDHFKQVNDTYGHGIGDQVLFNIANNCRTVIREIDILGRYGGEEFALLLPETSVANARIVAERMRQLVEATPIHTARGRLPLTISLGVAEMTAQMPNVSMLLDHADFALYQAKQRGRNCVVIFED